MFIEANFYTSDISKIPLALFLKPFEESERNSITEGKVREDFLFSFWLYPIKIDFANLQKKAVFVVWVSSLGMLLPAEFKKNFCISVSRSEMAKVGPNISVFFWT